MGQQQRFYKFNLNLLEDHDYYILLYSSKSNLAPLTPGTKGKTQTARAKFTFELKKVIPFANGAATNPGSAWEGGTHGFLYTKADGTWLPSEAKAVEGHTIQKLEFEVGPMTLTTNKNGKMVVNPGKTSLVTKPGALLAGAAFGATVTDSNNETSGVSFYAKVRFDPPNGWAMEEITLGAGIGYGVLKADLSAKFTNSAKTAEVEAAPVHKVVPK